jgi:hypothetical protein
MEGILPAAATPCTCTIPITVCSRYVETFGILDTYVSRAVPFLFFVRGMWLDIDYQLAWVCYGRDEIAGRATAG